MFDKVGMNNPAERGGRRKRLYEGTVYSLDLMRYMEKGTYATVVKIPALKFNEC